MVIREYSWFHLRSFYSFCRVGLTGAAASGWTTSTRLRQALIPFVARELNKTYQTSTVSKSSAMYPSAESIDAAIKKGFIRLDHEIVDASVEKVKKINSRRAAAELLAPALSGSCALLAFYDTNTRLLRVACTGDSRAVLGRRQSNGKWTATALSEDQTGSTESEVKRLRQEHPGEEHVVRNGRILGNLEPSRAFGDSFYKWRKEVQNEIKRHFLGRTPHPLLKTPPYVTAEPVVTTTEIDPTKGDFVVLATDGLWEMLSNEEVVGLVAQWLEQQKHLSQNGDSGKGFFQGWFSSEKGLPVEKSSQQDDVSGQRLPIRQRQYNITDNNRFVVEDKNAATHLVRNALGGKDRDMVCALLTLPSPYSRRYRYFLSASL
jgi:pyruvate dehydrogenase phosphatase